MFDKTVIATLARIALNSLASYLVTKSLIAPEQGAYISTNIDALIGFGTGAVVWTIGLRKAATAVAIPKASATNQNGADDRSR